MLPNRVHISQRATDQLKLLKSRTGVTPNILCRIAIALSIEEKHNANPNITDLSGSEFNIVTLLGDNAQTYEALIKQKYGDIKPKEAELILSAHIDHGIDRIKRAKSVLDLMSF